MPDLLQPPVKRGFFTAENAAIYARKSHAPDSARNQIPVPKPVLAVAVQSAEPSQSFAENRLKRVREQLSRIDNEIETCELDNSKRLKELADASTRLSEQERILDGRPMPGSRRPPSVKAERAGTWGELQPALPQVAPVAAVAPVQPAKPMGWEYDPPKATIPEPTPQPVVFAPVLS